MRTKRQGREAYQGDWGETRIFISSNTSNLHLEPGRDAVTLEWSTAGPAIPALHTLLADKVVRSRPKRCILIFKWDAEYHRRDWRSIWEKFAATVTSDPDSIQYVRFDFSTMSIELTSFVIQKYELGISYSIPRKIGERLRPADVQALRDAFDATAEPSIKEELDWSLEAIS